MIEALRLGLRSLVRERLRSLLTVLGVLIGTAAVVVVFALGSGARERITKEIASMGSNLLFIFPQGGRPSGAKVVASKLTDDDAQAIRRDAPAVLRVTVWSTLKTRVFGPLSSAKTGVMGIDRDYLAVRGFSIKEGRALSSADERTRAKVVLIGKTVKERIFGDEPAVGQFLRIGRVPYRIVGELAEKGRSPFEDQDDRVMMPISTWRSRISPTPGRRVQLIMAEAKSAADVESSERQIASILRERHHIRAGFPLDFQVRTQAGFQRIMESILDLVTTLLLSVAAIALFVGGVGVMNILLVSVTERTREIGVRMAIGASSTDILLQFLVEACVLTLFGGLLGAGLAVVVMLGLSSALGWSMSFNSSALFLAIGTSVATGLVFGLVPARRAAQMEPMEALRKE